MPEIRDIDDIEFSETPQFTRNRIVLRARRRHSIPPKDEIVGDLLSIHRDDFIRFLRDGIKALTERERHTLRDDVLGPPAPGMRRLMTYVDISESLLEHMDSAEVQDRVADGVVHAVLDSPER